MIWIRGNGKKSTLLIYDNTLGVNCSMNGLHKFQRRVQKFVIECQDNTIFDQIDAESARQGVIAEFNDELARVFRDYQIGDIEFPLETFRSRRGFARSYLRSLHSEPPELASIINSHNNNDEWQEFEFNRMSFSSCADSMSADVDIFCEDDLGYVPMIKAYSISECLADTTTTENSFHKRIPIFIQDEGLEKHLKKSYPDIDIAEIKKSGWCLVYGRESTDAHKHVNIAEGELVDIVALYTNSNLENLTRKVLECVVSTIAIAITAFTQIERHDREIFRRRALSRILSLVPVFSDRSKAPAENISNLIATIQSVLREHKSFGSCTGDNDISVRFVKMDLIKDLRNNEGTPRLAIYPPVFEHKVALQSTYFSAKRSRTIVKYLLGAWAEKNDWVVTASGNNRVGLSDTSQDNVLIKFSSQFKDTYMFFRNKYGKSCSGPSWRYRKSEAGSGFSDETEQSLLEKKEISGIYASKIINKQFWNDYYFDADNTEKTQTTAAFLLKNWDKNSEGDINHGVPFGILAFESKIPDAFSDSDLDVLQQISDSVGHLVDLNGWSSVHVDYRSKVRDAIIKSTFNKSGGELYKIAYELERCDLKIFRKWINGHEGCVEDRKLFRDAVRKVDELYAIHDYPETSFNDIRKSLEFIYTELVNDLDASNLKWKGQGPINALVMDENAFGIDKALALPILEFLESIPSNARWNARLSAIPRALLTRNVHDPTLTSLPKGFSADSIYVLDDRNEIRQILKFSVKKSIMQERRNYQTFVRYHTPLAARMPADGYAFDSEGVDMDESHQGSSKADQGYGVLVSDLVAGGKDPSTEGGDNENSVPESFESYLLGLYRASGDIDINEKYNEFLQATSHHFRSKSTKWESPIDRSFADEFKEWWRSDNYANSEFQRVIDDSSRLSQFADMNDGENGGDGKSTSFEELNVHSKNVISKFLSLSHQLVDNSVNKFENYINYVGDTLGYDEHQLKTNGKSPIKECDSLDKILETASERALLSNIEYLEKEFQALTSVIHGDSHGKNLTWSEAFRQFQMIDFENVRFGYVHSDQIKLAISTMIELPRNAIDEVGRSRPMPELIADDFEEAIVAMISLCKTLSSFHSSLNKRLNQNFFQMTFDLHSHEDIYNTRREIRKLNSKGVDFNIKRHNQVLNYLGSHSRSGILCRVLRRIFGSCFGLPGLDDATTHSLLTIDVITEKNYLRGVRQEVYCKSMLCALRAFALKEIGYHLREISKYDIGRMELWITILETIQQQVDVTTILPSRLEELSCGNKVIERLAKFSRDRNIKHDEISKGWKTRRTLETYEETYKEELDVDVWQYSADKPFCNWRIKTAVRQMLEMFPKNTSTVQKHQDKNVIGLMCAFMVLVAVNYTDS